MAIDWASARGALWALWEGFHAPIVAALATLCLILAGRLLRAGFLEALAGGAGVAAGWYKAGPALPVPLALPAAAAAVVALVASMVAPARARMPALLIIAAIWAWWLAGQPRGEAAVVAHAAKLAGVAAAAGLAGYLLTTAGRTAIAAAALSLSLHLVLDSGSHGPGLWTSAALVVAAVAVVLAAGTGGVFVVLPVAADLGAMDAAAVLATGRLTRGEVGAVEAAALAPLLALWLEPRLLARLEPVGQASAPLAAVLAVGLAGALAWGFAALVGTG
jgi:hypothetical protein